MYIVLACRLKRFCCICRSLYLFNNNKESIHGVSVCVGVCIGMVVDVDIYTILIHQQQAKYTNNVKHLTSTATVYIDTYTCIMIAYNIFNCSFQERWGWLSPD